MKTIQQSPLVIAQNSPKRRRRMEKDTKKISIFSQEVGPFLKVRTFSNLNVDSFSQLLQSPEEDSDDDDEYFTDDDMDDTSSINNPPSGLMSLLGKSK